MKKIIIALIVFMSFSTLINAQLKMTSNDFPTYQGVVEVNGQTADYIFSDLNVWYNNQFKAMAKTIQMEDTERQRLIIKASFPFEFTQMVVKKTHGKCDVLITFDTKDERFRFLIEVLDVYIDGNKSIMKDMLNKPNKKTSKMALEQVTIIKNKIVEDISVIEKTSSTDW
ncbi:DUF4468 domain-containing protein [Dysgonomonas massiliensis]|uniref:DUF4468 domain-containing protein n=1 Tax=Dysgonomonas massiliensis TaxID=2040292 RepID=UPI000C77CB5E|nr:DUF4468 domain-containing protein [Dysgonomonas massiliensis]